METKLSMSVDFTKALITKSQYQSPNETQHKFSYKIIWNFTMFLSLYRVFIEKKNINNF